MEDSDEEIFNPYYPLSECSSKDTVNMISVSQEESNTPKRFTKVLRSDRIKNTFELRAKENQLLNGKKYIEELSKLLCKPVSVSLTKLPLIPQVKQVPKKTIHKSKINYSHTPISKQITRIEYMKKEKKPVNKNKGKQIQTLNFKDNVQRIVMNHKKVSLGHKEQMRDLLKNIKQPYIKLYRIDEMINKIAQTFAKVIPYKNMGSNVSTKHVEEAQTELNSLSSQPSPLNTNENEYLKNKTPSSVLDSYINENSQYSDEICRFNNTRKRKKYNIIYDSDTDSDDNVNNVSSKIILKQSKRLKPDLPKTFLPNEEEVNVKTRHKNKTSLSDKQNSRDSEKCLNIKENLNTLENMPKKFDHVVEGNKDNSASNYVPSKTDVIHTSENVSLQSEDNNFVSVVEPVPECNGTRDKMHKSFVSQVELANKYKLCKELKVVLIKLDSLETSLNDKYSAAETEQLTNKYIELILNSNFLYTPLKCLPSNSNNQETFVETVEPDQFTEDLSTYKNVNSQTSTIVKDIQNISNKFPPSLSEEVQEQQVKSLQKQTEQTSEFVEKHCFQGSSKEILHQSLEQTLSSPINSITDTTTSNFSNKTENTINTRKLGILHKNYKIKSSSELLNSRPKEKISRKLSFNDKSKEIILNVESSKNIDAKKHRRFIPNILKVKNTFKDESISNNGEKVLTSGKKVHAIMLNPIVGNIVNLKADRKEKTISCISSATSSVKYNTTYKCIVCDFCFEDYSVLQQHLIKHKQKQNTVLSNIPTHTLGNILDEKQKETVSSSESRTIESSQPKDIQQTSTPISNKKNKVSLQKKLENKNVGKKGYLLNNKKPRFSKRKSRLPIESNETLECSICSKVYSTKYDLAAHIFLHSESELQAAYKNAKQKMKLVDDKKEKVQYKKLEQTTTKVSKIKKKKRKTDSMINATEKSLKTIHGKEVNHSKSSTEQEQNKLSIVHYELNIFEEEKVNMFETNKSIINEDECTEIQTLPMQNDLEKEKTNKILNGKRGFTICQCHNKSEISKNCLQIEIVLLCHTCRILFRSMECFEAHYCLPNFILCSQNRLESSRSPNLFCATCGMIFSSVQDVRHHLQVHARFKQSRILDFRCNICKVLFIGIGSLFYIHWSKHAKDPFWVADEQSFPQSSVIKPKRINNLDEQNELTLSKSIGTYIQVAEHICSNCKLPFVTENDLKNHELKCKVPNSVEDTSEQQTTVQKYTKIRLICSLCNDIFLEKLKFYKHIRSKHNFAPDLQFVCVSLTSTKQVIICTVCMKISDNIEQFEDHWLKHNINSLCFTCTYCEKDYNSLDSFLEHVNEHESIMKDDILSCKVKYQKSEFICTSCNFGFESQQGLNEHNVVHKLNKQVLKYTNKQTVEESSTPVSKEQNDGGGLLKLEELIIEQQNEISTQKQVDTNDQSVEKLTETSTKYNTGIDKEALISILEGNEDESENELTIDLTEYPEKSNDLQKEEKIEKQLVSTFPSSSTAQIKTNFKNHKTSSSIENVVNQSPSQNIKTASAVLDETMQASEHVISVASSQNTLTSTSQNITSNSKMHENQGQTLHESSNDSNNSQAILSANNEEPIALKKSSPLKLKQGFLRVKSLAELIDKNYTLQTCEFCECTFKDKESWAQHLLHHRTLNQNTKQYEPSIKNLPLQQSTNSTSVQTQAVTAENIRILPSASSVCQNPASIEKQTKQFHNVLTSGGGSEQLQSNITQQENSLSSAKSSTSAYHKNLPVCNIIRRTIALPRSSIKKGMAPIKIITNSSNLQKVRATWSVPCSTTTCSEVSSTNKITNSNASISLTLPSQSGSRVCLNNSQKVYLSQYPKSGAGYSTQEVSNTHSTHKEQNIEHTVKESRNTVNNAAAVSKSNLVKNYKQNLQTTSSKSRVQHASANALYQYLTQPVSSNPSSNNLTNNIQSQQIRPKQPSNTPVCTEVTRNTPASFHYKNSSSGGMSIVINQSTPTVQNIPVVSVLSTQGQQQQIYQPLVYTSPITNVDPYMQQSQNINQFSESTNIYQMPTNQYQVPITTYEVMLQPSGLVCPYCPGTTSFISQESLQLHIHSSHNYGCDICGQHFFDFTELSLHRIKHRFI